MYKRCCRSIRVDPDIPGEILEEQPATFKILPTGNRKGGPLLVSSAGFSYGIKVRLP